MEKDGNFPTDAVPSEGRSRPRSRARLEAPPRLPRGPPGIAPAPDSPSTAPAPVTCERRPEPARPHLATLGRLFLALEAALPRPGPAPTAGLSLGAVTAPGLLRVPAP